MTLCSLARSNVCCRAETAGEEGEATDLTAGDAGIDRGVELYPDSSLPFFGPAFFDGRLPITALELNCQ